MSKKSVQCIRIKDVIAGEVESCDWVFVKDGLITEVNAYYDSVTNRQALES